MGIISYADFVQAGRNWDNVLGLVSKHGNGWPTWDDGFRNWVGTEAFNEARWKDNDNSTSLVELPDEGCRRMQLLAGPHYRAIIKARQIQQKELLADHETVPYKK